MLLLLENYDYAMFTYHLLSTVPILLPRTMFDCSTRCGDRWAPSAVALRAWISPPLFREEGRVVTCFGSHAGGSVPRAMFLYIATTIYLSVTICFTMHNTFQGVMLTVFYTTLVFPKLAFTRCVLHVAFTPMFALLVALLFVNKLILNPKLSFCFHFPR